jgi:Holliday junction resolvase RusA-like endonuclease
MKMITKTLSIKPLSINACFQGRRFKNKAHKQYEAQLLWQLKKSGKIEGKYRIEFDFYFKTTNCDVSNYIKVVEDAIVKAGLVDDDRYCYELTARKHIGEPKIELKIEPME